MDAFERELQSLDDDLENGAISPSEYNSTIRNCEQDYRGQAREAAEEAYDNEMQRW